jgi:hypothetical protein
LQQTYSKSFLDHVTHVLSEKSTEIPEQTKRVCLLFLESRCEKHRLMMVVAKDVEERTTSAPRVNERKQTGTQNFNTRDYKCHSHSVMAGYRSKLSCYVKEIHLLAQLMVYTDCEMVRDFICGYLLPYVLTHLLTYSHTYLLSYLLTHNAQTRALSIQKITATSQARF